MAATGAAARKHERRGGRAISQREASLAQAPSRPIITEVDSGDEAGPAEAPVQRPSQRARASQRPAAAAAAAAVQVQQRHEQGQEESEDEDRQVGPGC